MIEKDPSTRALITQRHFNYYVGEQLMSENPNKLYVGQTLLAISRLKEGTVSSPFLPEDIEARLREFIVRPDINKIP